MLFSEIHLRTGKEELHSLVMKHSQSLFETPDCESWRFELTGTGRPSSLIERGRQLIVWANAILPLFLAYAKLHNDSDLERLIYRIFMILPPETLNSKTLFMEIQLWASSRKKLKLNSFGYHQGLIQVYSDFCRNFYQGCAECEFLELLRTRAV